MYYIAPRNDFNSLVFSGGFNRSIASTFSSFGLIPFSSIPCPNLFVWFMKNSDFLLLARYPAFSNLFKRQIVSFRDLVCFLVLLQLCRLTMPVCNIQVFGQFFLGILWVYRRVRETLFYTGNIRWNFLRLVQIRIVGLFLPIVSFGRKHNPDLFRTWIIVIFGFG